MATSNTRALTVPAMALLCACATAGRTDTIGRIASEPPTGASPYPYYRVDAVSLEEPREKTFHLTHTDTDHLDALRAEKARRTIAEALRQDGWQELPITNAAVLISFSLPRPEATLERELLDAGIQNGFLQLEAWDLEPMRLCEQSHGDCTMMRKLWRVTVMAFADSVDLGRDLPAFAATAARWAGRDTHGARAFTLDAP